jgi:hypothetical protein
MRILNLQQKGIWLIAISLILTGNICGQKQDKQLLMDAFRDVLLGTNRPGGSVVLENNCGTRETFASQRQARDSKEDALEFLERTNPAYKVLKSKGAINLLPADYEPELLQTKINDYFIDSDKSADVVLQELLELPELKDAVERSGLHNWKLQVIIGLQPPPRKWERHYKHVGDITVREALNAIAKFYDNGIWAFTEYKCEEGKRSSLVFTKK